MEMRPLEEIMKKRNETRIYLANHEKELCEPSITAMRVKAETLEWVLSL